MSSAHYYRVVNPQSSSDAMSCSIGVFAASIFFFFRIFSKVHIAMVQYSSSPILTPFDIPVSNPLRVVLLGKDLMFAILHVTVQ